ncbi:MAG: hypothetical protein DRR15_04695 [Gammaproteobacteria bacterium]|nr:MAG: hypothetical protein DRR15_04695 [Gammaproteobacteria bacterium]
MADHRAGNIFSLWPAFFVTRSNNVVKIASAVIAVCNALGVRGTTMESDFVSGDYFSNVRLA